MSIRFVEAEIRKFLASAEPEVMCLTGQWGVGKTFAWKKYLTDARKTNQITLQRYAYVSLFGINSIEELKYSIFENSVQSHNIGIEPSIETIRSNMLAASERIGRKSLSFLQQIPFIKNHTGGLAPIWYLTLHEMIICLDDVERRGKGLSIRDLLGLVSSLKEQKRCKATIILNDEAMDEETEFKTYFEKVIDISLTFNPSPAESVAIVLNQSDPLDKLIGQHCITLGISNIRLIRRISHTVRMASDILKQFENAVLKQAVHSLVLFVWSIYEPSKAPSIEFLRDKRGKSLFGTSREHVTSLEASWTALLDKYQFTSMDEFDLVLVDGVRKGYFDLEQLKKEGSTLNSTIKAGSRNESFMDAWRLYHDSFDDNEQSVLDTIYKAFNDDIQSLSPSTLASTVQLFKDLGRESQARELLEAYIDRRRNERRLFDLSTYPFSGDITEPEVIRRFNEQFAEFKDERSVGAILLEIAKQNGWNEDDIAKLSNATADDYYYAFTNSKGHELRQMINASLQFDSFGNARPEWLQISKLAKEALSRIGAKSRINLRRVSQFGVDVKSTP